MKLICAALAFACLGLQAKEDKDLVSKPDMGISIRKPPKNDEWDFRDRGFFVKPVVVVAHKVDEVVVEIHEQDKAPGLSSYNLREIPNQEYKYMSNLDGITEAKKITAGTQKLPGGGAGNVQASYLEMTFKKADKLTEFREWFFIGKNQNLYKAVVTCDEGMYKKHQKAVDYILATIDTFKVK